MLRSTSNTDAAINRKETANPTPELIMSLAIFAVNKCSLTVSFRREFSGDALPIKNKYGENQSLIQ